MIAYLQRLLNERDQLTATAQKISDEAAKQNKDLTDTESSTLATIAERCGAIDAQIETYNKQAESTRAYAQLRSSIGVAEQAAEDQRAAEARERAASDSDRRPVRRGAPAAVEDRSWSAPFERSGILTTYTGHGSSGRVELGPVIEERSAPSGLGVITTQTPPEGAVSPMRWTPPTPTWQYRLLDVVNVVPTDFGAVDWVRYEPNPPAEAQEVAEGDLKPEMPLSISLESDTLKTDAHWKAITRQALSDIAGIRQEIDTRLRAGIMAKLQTRVATALTADTAIPTETAADLLSGIRIGIGSMDDESGYMPNAVLLNPADWAQIDLTLLGQTLAGAVVNGGSWGLTFVASSKVPAGTAFVGDLRAGVTLFQRRTTEVYITDSHADFFLRNQLVLLGETRAFAAVTEPMAMIKVTASAGGAGGASAPAAPVGE